MAEPSKEELLALLQDLKACMPPRATIRHRTEENHNWLGRAQSLIKLWDPYRTPLFNSAVQQLSSTVGPMAEKGWQTISTTINEAINDLSVRLPKPLGAVASAGEAFVYHKALCDILKTAQKEVFIVDPYLSTDFLADYMPSIAGTVKVRLLASQYYAEMEPAVRKYVQQSKKEIEVRHGKKLFHERWIYIDSAAGYLSGSSIKDGGNERYYSSIIPTESFPLTLKHSKEIWLVS